ncbi:hypothetical protein IU433_28075 [Nocardia puris]|uniref:hypothetical protein n=1 Tax=Nocardia puris TaxID=208602 RepID=UPI0018953815|nr:hypothetical protein [Nocardia puris]MBF6214367.1 hypothetical protein [Nocardia puris]MBF6368982.1 hypothetical protein [Nocardia puris]MBF6462870.1 hypothetical protein [Nocardia puris]
MAQSKAPEAVVRAGADRTYIPDTPFPERGVTLLTGTKKFLVDEGKIREDFDLEEWFYRPVPTQS